MNSFQIRLVAMVTMMIDHVGYLFFPSIIAFRIVGRIAFILFAFLTAEGICHTKNKNTYIIRLLICGLISEIPYNLMLTSQLSFSYAQNVCFTLALGAIACKLIEERRRRETFITLLGLGGVLAVVQYIPMDYGLAGVLAIIIMYLLNSTRDKRTLGAVGSSLITTVGLPLQIWSLMSMPFIYLYNGKQGKRYGGFFYLFYPGHMLLLWGISHIVA